MESFKRCLVPIPSYVEILQVFGKCNLRMGEKSRFELSISCFHLLHVNNVRSTCSYRCVVFCRPLTSEVSSCQGSQPFAAYKSDLASVATHQFVTWSLDLQAAVVIDFLGYLTTILYIYEKGVFIQVNIFSSLLIKGNVLSWFLFFFSTWDPITHVIIVLAGIMIIVLDIGPKVRGFKPGRVRSILRVIKIRGTTSFGGEIKPSNPCR
jgi:hypothetical protein